MDGQMLLHERHPMQDYNHQYPPVPYPDIIAIEGGYVFMHDHPNCESNKRPHDKYVEENTDIIQQKSPTKKRPKRNPFQTPAKLLPRLVKPASTFLTAFSPISPLSPRSPSDQDATRMEHEGEQVWEKRFKIPSFVTPTAITYKPSTPMSMESRTLLATPTKSRKPTAAIPAACAKPAVAKFKTPSSLSNSDGTKMLKACSPAIEASRLERRLLVLEQALKYLREKESTHDDQENDDGEKKGKLERLGEMWLEIGKKAATALFEYSNTPPTNNSTETNPFSGYGNITSDRGGFSSFGFAPCSPLYNSNPFSHHDDPAERTPFLSSGFERVDKLREHRSGDYNDIREDPEEHRDQDDLPQFPKTIKRYNKGGIARLVDPYDSDSEDMEEEGKEEEERLEEAQWNLGKFLNTMGIDPILFEWNEVLGDFKGIE